MEACEKAEMKVKLPTVKAKPKPAAPAAKVVKPSAAAPAKAVVKKPKAAAGEWDGAAAVWYRVPVVVLAWMTLMRA